MSLNEAVLLFDKEKISDTQIKSHVKHYVELANKGMNYFHENKKIEAMECLKEIRVTLKEEYKYYTKSKIESIMWKDNKYNKYLGFIRDALAKQNSPTSYKWLYSNLYDVADYGMIHCSEFLN
ncbi:hypothetical protein FZC83_02165 [Rossellomorea marisflavi]|uniref:Uncharacterized protein n=1 Tax=Rossellomorea marisflavi TaxID=189381 RepID=A0A5D4S1H3_9BACI|nr:hypothetical protein [Rossellomorea marisflavi]TYS56401.1 hypothetical protein FZC83_02165 [Rossellomorea marisflavi]